MGRYKWSRVKSNRCKANKRRDVTDDHLAGRLRLLNWDLEELGNRFPVISAEIEAEVALIEDEIALRAAGKSKPSPAPVEEAPHVWDDFESLAELENTALMEDDPCEN